MVGRLRLVVVLPLLLSACSGGGGDDSASTTAGTSLSTATTDIASTTTTEIVAEGPLPPHQRDDLAALFDPIVEPLGYRVTRAALINRDTYEVGPEEGHLALYLAPSQELTGDQYAADLPAIAQAFIPLVFEVWPELSSFDVCQEPFGSEAETPPSLTIIDLTRQAAGAIEWDDIDLSALIQAGSTVEGLSVWARAFVRDSAVWQAAEST